MSEKPKKYDAEFGLGVVRIVEETRKPMMLVARGLGVNEGTLGNWVNLSRDGSGRVGASVGRRLRGAETATRRERRAADGA